MQRNWLIFTLFAAGCAAAPQATTPAAAPAPVAGHEHHAGSTADTVRYTEADVRFMSGMIGHHAQAIEMARLAPTRSASESIQVLAARIINAQQDEIAIMQTWLRDRGQPVPAAAHAGHHGEMMPGMLTAEQLARLERARGREFDRLFLTFMIQHHRGAVAMVTELYRHPGAGEEEPVFKFASDVNVDQATEIARMQRMLADLILEGDAP